MAEKYAFLVDYVEGGLCVDYTDVEIVRRCNSGSDKDKGKWENDDYLCRGHILNGMSDSLFDVYMNVESVKELWDSLESKYMAEDSSSKKFIKCGKTGHFKRDCRSGNKKNANAGGRKRGLRTIPNTKVDAIAWWIDSGATTHVCKDRSPYTPHRNGVAERKNKAHKEMVNFMLSYSGLSEGFWGEAIAVVRLPDPKRKSLGEKGIGCIFVGYAEHSKAYRFYVIEPSESVSINSIIKSRDAIFDENRFSSIPRPKDIILNLVESQRDDHSDDVPSETPEPCKGKRVRKAKSYGYDFQLYLVEGSRDHVGSQYSYCYSIEKDPRTYDEAMQSRDTAF
nr:zinc finger, CCHC-type [Tanacetum cinerariifolium]